MSLKRGVSVFTRAISLLSVAPNTNNLIVGEAHARSNAEDTTKTSSTVSNGDHVQTTVLNGTNGCRGPRVLRHGIYALVDLHIMHCR